MKCKLVILSLTLLCGSMSAKAQVRFTEDPTTAINMDIEAKPLYNRYLISKENVMFKKEK